MNTKPIGYVNKFMKSGYYNTRIGAEHEYGASAVPVYAGSPPVNLSDEDVERIANAVVKKLRGDVYES